MGNSDEKMKAAARCRACGTVIAVEVWDDGTIYALGMPTDCCEAADYEVLSVDRDELITNDVS